MIIYLDNCCFNRPFDDQSQIRINLESQAKLYVQEKIQNGEIDLAWSYMLDYENIFNPFKERQAAVDKWRKIAIVDISESQHQLTSAKKLVEKGIKNKDALHIACAIESGCNYFLTTDDFILKKLQTYKMIKVLNPIDFLKIIEP